MTKSFVTTFVFAFFFCDVSAQYNDTIGHYIGAMATGNISKTNDSHSYLFNNALKFGIHQKTFTLNSTNSWVYGSTDKVLANNDFNSTLDFDLYKTLPHFYYWGLANYQSSLSLKINNQYQAGVGVAYNIIDRKYLKFNLSDGILYDNSDIYLEDTMRDVYSTFRNSFRILFHLGIKDIVKFDAAGFYQNSFSSGSDYIVKANLGLAVKLRKWLSLTTALTYNRFNRTMRENILFTYGITMEKYF